LTEYVLYHSFVELKAEIESRLCLGGRVFLQFACLAFMPLGDALTLVFTEPLWTIILSKLVLRIRIGWWKTLFGIVLISGMVLTIQPDFMFHNDPGNTLPRQLYEKTY
jgi:drug/metabolite transporter (DMT)-like permease